MVRQVRSFLAEALPNGLFEHPVSHSIWLAIGSLSDLENQKGSDPHGTTLSRKVLGT